MEAGYAVAKTTEAAPMVAPAQTDQEVERNEDALIGSGPSPGAAASAPRSQMPPEAPPGENYAADVQESHESSQTTP